MRRQSLGITLGLVFLAFTIACAGSPHDRAEVVMESAVERLTVVHDRLTSIISSVEGSALGGCDAARPGPDIASLLRVSGQLREQMSQLHSEYLDSFNDCRISVGVVERELTDLRRLRDLFTPDGLIAQVTTVRSRLASVAPDVLEGVLDAAAGDDEAWVALQQVNAPAGRYVGADDWDSFLDETKETLERHMDEYAPALSLAVDKRDRFFELAGVPVPEG